jgi:hypothetical protein
MRTTSTLAKRVASLALAGVAMLAASAVVAAPAQAGCKGKICVYENRDLGGGADYWNIGDSNLNGDQFVNGVAENDQITSLDSWTADRNYWFTDSWWSGDCARVLAWDRSIFVGSRYDNKFSSWGWSEGYGCNDIPYNG